MVGSNGDAARAAGRSGAMPASLTRRARSTHGTAQPAGFAAFAYGARWSLVALVVVLAVLVVDLRGLLEQRRVDAMPTRDRVAHLAERDTVHGAVARAYQLQASGKLRDAIADYGAIALDVEPELRAVQLFNLANLYIERAVQLEREDEIQPAQSLVELAKQNYREILARDPDHWDARYNLSRALEMLPDIAAVDYENERNPERSPLAPQATRTYEGLP